MYWSPALPMRMTLKGGEGTVGNWTQGGEELVGAKC